MFRSISPSSTPGPSEDDDTLVDQIGTLQGALRAYIGTLLGNIDDVDDVLQETNHHLWEQRSKFEMRPFLFNRLI